jgi:hypothetical protein
LKGNPIYSAYFEYSHRKKRRTTFDGADLLLLRAKPATAIARMLGEAMDPVPHVIPVVGVPGFQIQFPAFTITCNQEFLEEQGAYPNIRLARASCPFEAYEALADIRRDYPGCYMYVAPIGTKPHAVGAIWYAIEHAGSTEIMYDHPTRRPKRTEGVGPIHMYCLKDGG